MGRTRALLALLESCVATRQFASALKMLGLLKVSVVESDLKNDVNNYVGFFSLFCLSLHRCMYVPFCVCMCFKLKCSVSFGLGEQVVTREGPESFLRSLVKSSFPKNFGGSQRKPCSGAH